MTTKNLEGKKILVTAGPTWVGIDRVRVMTNISSGKTGCIIAKKAKEKAAEVKILLGPGRLEEFSPMFLRGIKVIRYYYFDELLNLMKKEISTRNYDVIIHSAAVSDYIPTHQYKDKIPSGKNSLIIKLKPSIKIIRRIKEWHPDIFLVQFKLEVGKKRKELIDIGYKSMIENKADLVVVNDLNKISKERYEAFIISSEKTVIKVYSRKNLANNLLKIIADKV